MKIPTGVAAAIVLVVAVLVLGVVYFRSGTSGTGGSGMAKQEAVSADSPQFKAKYNPEAAKRGMMGGQ